MSYRFAFEPLIAKPEEHPNLVISYDENVIIIRDGFPKSVRHWLVIPRDNKVSRLDPIVALANANNYAMLKPYVEKAKRMITQELQDQYGGDWLNFVRCGVHVVPSLANLHIHVILQDFNSNRMKHKKHYNSFTTPFFVPFEDFDPSPSRKTLLKNDSNYKKKKLQHLLRTKVSRKYDSDSDYDLEGEMHENTHEELLESLNEETQHVDPASQTILQVKAGSESGPLPYLEIALSERELMVKISPMKCTYCLKSFSDNFKALKSHLLEEFISRYNQIS